MDNLYKMTASLEDYVNLTADGTLSWRCASSCMSDSDVDLEDWQNRLLEVSQRRCVIITKELRWIGSEVSTVPTFDGLSDIQLFLKQYEEQIPLEKRLEVLDIALRATPARWWAAHKNTISSWSTCQRLMGIRFRSNTGGMLCMYDAQTDPTVHIEECVKLW